MKKIIINIIGTPRKFIKENCENIYEKIIKPNNNVLFYIFIHTSYNYVSTTHKQNLDNDKKLDYKNENDLYNLLLNTYRKLSNEINIIIEPIDFNIGKHHSWKHMLLYLRQHRLSYHINNKYNIDEFDSIITIRNDVILINNLNINDIKNNFYSIIGPGGGFKGYANGDFDFCFIYNIKNYKIFCKCIEYLWYYSNNIYYPTNNLVYISPIFLENNHHLKKEYYDNLGNNFNNEIKNSYTDRFKLALSELFINHLTNFLYTNNSYWDVKTFENIKTKLLTI